MQKPKFKVGEIVGFEGIRTVERVYSSDIETLFGFKKVFLYGLSGKESTDAINEANIQQLSLLDEKKVIKKQRGSYET